MTAAAENAQLMEAPELDIDPYAIDVIKDPYAYHEALREAGPVARIKPYGVYAVGRHAECQAVLNDPERFSAAAGIGIQDIRKPGRFRVPNRLLENDPPSHTQIRGVLNRLLSPIVIRGLREHMETEAAKLVDEILEQGEVDGVKNLAEEYIFRVFPHALGVKLDREKVLAIGEMRFNQSGPENELFRRAMERAEPYLEWFEYSTTRENVEPGTICDTLFDCEDRGEIEEGIASNMIRSFVGGGTDSTIAAIGHTLNLLANNPDQWAILKGDPSKVRPAFEEAIRMESPFQVTYRTTTDEIELSGVRLDADTKIGVFPGAGGRDPRQWENPSKYDVTRDTAGIHVSFGHGVHTCIGQMLARLEADAILSALVAKVDRLEPAGPARINPVNQMRVLGSLPLRVTAA